MSGRRHSPSYVHDHLPAHSPSTPQVGVLTAAAAVAPNLQDHRSNGPSRVQNPSQSICSTAGQLHAVTATTMRPHMSTGDYSPLTR